MNFVTVPKIADLATFVIDDQETTRLPVRSDLFKQRSGELVVS